MTTELVREIAEQIVQEQLLHNWKFYGLLAAITLILNMLGNWVSSYARKRGETLATKSDMQEILKQLKATTQATEEIKASVSHADWVSREWKQVRRLKLEELMSATYSLDKWLDQTRSKWIHKRDVEPEHDAVDRVTLLGALYFAELKTEVAAVGIAYRSAASAVLTIAQTLRAADANLQAKQTAMQATVTDSKAKLATLTDLKTKQAILANLQAEQAMLEDFVEKWKAAYQVTMDEYTAKWPAVYQPARAAIAALEAKAAKLMQEIGGA